MPASGGHLPIAGASRTRRMRPIADVGGSRSSLEGDGGVATLTNSLDKLRHILNAPLEPRRTVSVGECPGFSDFCQLYTVIHLNLAYRWFCRLGLDGDVPDHSTFSKNRHGRFRESDLLRKLFETVVARCMKEGIVGGEAFAVDASIIVADAHRRRGVAKIEDLDPTSNRAVAEYLSVLDDAAFGGATPVEPKTISPTDPAARYQLSRRLCLFRQLSHRSEACGDYGRRGDDDHSSG